MSNSPIGALDATDNEIANRITMTMRTKGITQEQLSDKTGISYPTLRRSLKGLRSLSFSEFGRIAKELGVSGSELLTDDLAGRVAA